MPKVSVIIPVYNTEKYISQCLDSVCRQTLKDIEIICINDCSTDSSLKIVQDFAQKDSRIRLIDFPENKGVAAARNAGIEAATGEYIGFVDSDDFVDLDFYEKLYVKAKEIDADVVKGNIYDCDENGESPKLADFYNMNDNIRENKAYFYYGFTSAIYKRTLLNFYNIRFPQNISYFEDPFFSIQVTIVLSSLTFDDSARYFYVNHRASAAHNYGTLKKIKDFAFVIKALLDLLDKNEFCQKDYLIYVSFLYRSLRPWCSDSSLPREVNKYAQMTLFMLLKNNKYGMEELLSFYFDEEIFFSVKKKLINQKVVLELLRKNVKK